MGRNPEVSTYLTHLLGGLSKFLLSSQLKTDGIVYSDIILPVGKNSVFRKSQKITDNNLGSCYMYYMKPGTQEKKHYHNGIEILYVLKGNCRTHKQGKVYFYKKGEAHQVINDSKEELILVCLQIPPNLKEITTLIW